MSYTFTQTGSEIQAILDRAEAGGQIDQDIATKQDALTFDAVPTEGSTNPAESGGIYDAIQAGGATALAAFATDSVSGDVVSFEDGADNIPVKSFVGSIIPQQNLNGYDNPWPAGGGKNKAVMDDVFPITKYGITITHNNDGSITINGTATANVSINLMSEKKVANGTWVISGVPANAAGVNLNIWARSDSAVGKYARTVNGQSGSFLIENETVYIYCTVESGATVNNVKAFIQLEQGSTATSYAPYSNICPISGWSGAEITRAGGNLLTGLENGSRLSDGEKTTSTVRVRSTNYMPVKAGDTVMVQASTSASKNLVVSCQAWASNTDSGNTRLYDSGWQSIPFVYTIPSGANYCTFVLRYAPESTISAAEITASVFAGDTILLTFGSTVYAGTITALGGGKWSVQPTHAIETYDKNTDWRRYSGGFYANSTGLVATLAQISNGICNAFATRVGASEEGFNAVSIGSSPTRYNPRFYHGGLTEIADWVQYLTDTNLTIQFCYVPDTLPDPIIVSGDDLATLLGANTVWLNCGSVTEMEYRADTALYVQKLIGGGTLSTLSMASPSPSLSLGRVDVLAEQEAAEPEADAEPEQPEEVAEEPEQAEEE